MQQKAVREGQQQQQQQRFQVSTTISWSQPFGAGGAWNRSAALATIDTWTSFVLFFFWLGVVCCFWGSLGYLGYIFCCNILKCIWDSHFFLGASPDMGCSFHPLRCHLGPVFLFRNNYTDLKLKNSWCKRVHRNAYGIRSPRKFRPCYNCTIYIYIYMHTHILCVYIYYICTYVFFHNGISFLITIQFILIRMNLEESFGWWKPLRWHWVSHWQCCSTQPSNSIPMLQMLGTGTGDTGHWQFQIFPKCF